MSYNEHTKKKMQTGIPNNNYRDNWDLIFNKKKVFDSDYFRVREDRSLVNKDKDASTSEI